MRVIPLKALPNQSLSVVIDGTRWDLNIKVANSLMIADVYRDDVALILGTRILSGTPILPYEYLMTKGNFLMVMDDESLSDWTKFETTQTLYFLSPDDIADL